MLLQHMSAFIVNSNVNIDLDSLVSWLFLFQKLISFYGNKQMHYLCP